MILKSFISGVLVRIALLLAFTAFFCYSLLMKEWFFLTILSFGFLLLSVIEIYRYVNKTNRDLVKFMSALEHSDFQVGFKPKLHGASFDTLHNQFEGVMRKFQLRVLEKEAHYQQTTELLERVPMGILAIDADENVTIINAKAQELLSLPPVRRFASLAAINPSLAQTLKSSASNQNHKYQVELKSGQQTLNIERIRWSGNKPSEAWVIMDLSLEQTDAQMDAWLKLIRILTHEIMNSITAIGSLSETAKSIAHNPESQQDVVSALEIIHKRSKGLESFVDDYRKLTQVPAPKKEWIDIHPIVERQSQLFSEEIRDGQITIECPKNLKAFADSALLEQVLSNLLKNAISATNEGSYAEITIQVQRLHNAVQIEVKDHGRGISASEQLEIFTPFYSTKENGSGIGLSLSRQIMRNHNGNLHLKQVANPTVFAISIPDF